MHAAHATEQPERARRRDEEGCVFYECGRCGSRTTDAGDVAVGFCAMCGWYECEVASHMRQVIARAG